MLIKWMQCVVPDASLESFSQAQRQWRRMRYADGLVVQVGGFDVADDNRACVLAIWRDEASYARFMKTVHDAVTEASDQSDHYSSLEISRFEAVSRMPGQEGKLFLALSRGSWLRVADCSVKAESRSEFVRAQLDVWTPGMAAAKGMYGGLFSQSLDDDSRFLVATAWQDEEHHGLYVENHLPTLKERAPKSIETVKGTQVRLEPNWTVIGVGG